MPTLKQIDCSIELGPAHVKLPEHGTLIRDGYIETFIAVPDTSIPFTIHIKSQGYIHSGLAFFVFIDGEYQCNRNRIELKTPGRGAVPKDYEVEFRLRQKEEKTADGRFVAREWTFEKLDRVKADKAGNTRKSQYVENVGTIEVVVLRCQSDKEDSPPRLMSTQVREVQATPTKTKEQERKQKAKEPSVHESEPRLGGLFGIFDGACDNMNLDGAGDDQPRDLGYSEPPQTPQIMVWDSTMGEYRLAPQGITQGGFGPSPERLHQQHPPYTQLQQFGDYGVPTDIQLQSPANHVGDQPGSSQQGRTRRARFEIGGEEDTTPPRISEDSDPNKLIVRFRQVLKGRSPYTEDEYGVSQFREELDTYKTQLRRYKKHNPELYKEKILNIPSVQQLEALLELMREQLGLFPEHVAEPPEEQPAEPSEGGLLSRLKSQVITDGAMDDYRYGQPAAYQPVPNNTGWQEVGQGNANFGTQRQTFGQGPAQHNQAPMRFYQDDNGNIFPAGPTGNQGYHAMPQSVVTTTRRAIGRNQQQNRQFATAGQFQGQGVGQQFGYGQGGMGHGGFKRSPWVDNGAPFNNAAGWKNDPMNGDPFTPSERAMGENYVDSRYKDDGKWDKMCEEWKEERERKGIPGDPAINNPKFQAKAAEDERKMNERKMNERKMNERKKSEGKKTKSSHGWGPGDGDANQNGWGSADWGENNNNAGNAAVAAWGDNGKKSSRRGKNDKQVDQWADAKQADPWGDAKQADPWAKANHADEWGKTGDAWNNSAKDGGNDNAWPNNNDSKKSSHGRSQTGSNHSKTAGSGRSNSGNGNADGWASQGCNNGNNRGGGWGNDAGSNKGGGWDNPSQTRSKTASQAAWSASAQEDTRSPRRTREDVNSKAHIKPYFNDWNKPPAYGDSTAYRNRDTPRDAYKYPALPRPTVLSNEAKDKSHGVHAGKGAEYSHKCRRPVYVDSMEQPYAVFTFKYRSKKAVENILKVKVDQVDFKKIQEQMEFEKLMQTPKDRLAAEVARMRMGQSRQPRSEAGAKSTKGDWDGKSNNGGWDGKDESPIDLGGWGNYGQPEAPVSHARARKNDQKEPAQAAIEAWKPDVGGARKVGSPNDMGGWRSYGKPSAPASRIRGDEKDTPPGEVIQTGKYAGMIWKDNFGPVEPPKPAVTDITSLFF